MASLRVSLFLLALAACDAATTNDFRGPPVASLRGTMTAKQGLSLSGPVRLSVLWFSMQGAGPGQLLGLRSDEVEYTGTFPQAYELRFDGPPPAETIQTTDAGTTGTSGVLVAYEDTNGDGKLTLTPGVVVDRVLGASSQVFLATRSATPTYDAQYLVYLEATGETLPPGVALGYDVQTVRYVDGGVTAEWQASSAAMIPLELTGEAELSLLACSDLYAAFATGGAATATLCGTAPPNRLTPIAAVSLYNDAGNASVQFGTLGSDGGIQVPAWAADASVTINGVPLERSLSGSFSLFESPNRSIRDTNTIRVTAVGFPPWEGSCTMPPAVTVTAPTSVDAGAPVVVSWTDVPGGFVFGSVGSQSAYSPATSVSAVAPTDGGALFFTVGASGPVLPPPPVRCSRTVTGTIAVRP